MKKTTVFLILIIILTLLFSLQVNAAVDLKDVPKDHWAYQSVKNLVEKGYLSLYEDGTFGGNENISRYELAVLIDRIIDNIEQGKAQPEQQDVETLRKLTLEFRDELVDIASNQEDYNAKLEKLQETNIIQNEELSKLHEDIVNVNTDIASTKGEVATVKDNLEQTINQINQINKDINNLNSRLDASEKEVSQIVDTILEMKKLEDRVASLEEDISGLQGDLASTSDQINERDQSIAALKEELSQEITDKIDSRHSVTLTQLNALQNKVNKLEERLDSYQTQEAKPAAKKMDQNTILYLGAAAVLVFLLGSG